MKILSGRSTGVAAGVLFCARDTNRVLFVLRSPLCDSPNTWCCLGGGIEYGESIKQGLRREVAEESRYTLPFDPILLYVDKTQPDFRYYNFFAWVDKEFVPALNDEHTDWGWFDELPSPLHPGLMRALTECYAPT